MKVKDEGRCCFALVWFDNETEAEEFGAIVRARGDRYNGGFFHGTICGRDRNFDYIDSANGPLFAVTTS